MYGNPSEQEKWHAKENIDLVTDRVVLFGGLAVSLRAAISSLAEEGLSLRAFYEALLSPIEEIWE